MRTLESEFHIEVDKEQIGYEGSELYLDEIDELLIHSDMLNGLPEPLLFETWYGMEWLGIITMIIGIGTRKRMVFTNDHQSL